MVPQTDPRVEGLVGAQVLVEPLGMVRVMQWLHRGRLFDVFEGEYAGQAVCLKTPVLKSADPVDADEHAFSDLVHSDQTNVFTTRKGCTAVVAADPALQSRLLTVEAQRIRDTQGRWNHEVLALGVWDPTGYVEPGPFDLATAMDRYRPVLVTPRHLGQTLDQLDRATQRRLFPRMLPALWDALAFAPHGDLSPCNLVWDRHNDRFALIDPGVALTSERKRRGPKSLDEGLTVMTTNAVHYPLICPIGDLSADGRADLIVAAGFGGGPRVAAFDGRSVAAGGTAKLFGDFFAFEQFVAQNTTLSVSQIPTSWGSFFTQHWDSHIYSQHDVMVSLEEWQNNSRSEYAIVRSDTFVNVHYFLITNLL